jgi:hypothetical protein
MTSSPAAIRPNASGSEMWTCIDPGDGAAHAVLFDACAVVLDHRDVRAIGLGPGLSRRR